MKDVYRCDYHDCPDMFLTSIQPNSQRSNEICRLGASMDMNAQDMKISDSLIGIGSQF